MKKKKKNAISLVRQAFIQNDYLCILSIMQAVDLELESTISHT